MRATEIEDAGRRRNAVDYASTKEKAMYERMFRKRERRMKAAEQGARDMRAWVMIAAIFFPTLLVAWVPLIFKALHHV